MYLRTRERERERKREREREREREGERERERERERESIISLGRKQSYSSSQVLFRPDTCVIACIGMDTLLSRVFNHHIASYSTLINTNRYNSSHI